MCGFQVVDKRDGRILPVREIDFVARLITTKTGAEKRQEIIDAGEHFCDSCDPEGDDYLSFDDAILMHVIGEDGEAIPEVAQSDIDLLAYMGSIKEMMEAINKNLTGIKRELTNIRMKE